MTKDAIIESNIEIRGDTKTDSLNVENTAVFNGNVVLTKASILQIQMFSILII